MTERLYVCASSGEPLLTNDAFRTNYPDATAPVYPQSFSKDVEMFDLDGRPIPLAEWPSSRALRGEQVRGLELRVLYKHSGQEFINKYNASPVFDPQGKVSMAVVTSEDITIRKQTEKALIQTEKLASVGRLAASIAHEVNSPLAAATNAVYLARSDPGLSTHGHDALRIADQELRRAAHITQQTLGVVRETDFRRSPLALPKLIDEILGVYAGKLRDRGITVQQRYRCGTCREACVACFVANAGEMRQVVSNLLVNGMDALRDNGTLHVRLSRVSLFDGLPRIRLTFADNGCGIRTENLKRIFEPFFTTKESTGTGLGLMDLARNHSQIRRLDPHT